MQKEKERLVGSRMGNRIRPTSYKPAKRCQVKMKNK